MKVHELMAVLAESDPHGQVHVALDLGSPDSVSFHAVQEAHESVLGGAEIVVYEAFDMFESTPSWLARALRSEGGSSGGASGAC